MKQNILTPVAVLRAISLLLVTTFLVGCQGFFDGKNQVSFTIEQEPPVLNFLERTPGGSDHGNQLFFTAKLKDHQGNNGTLNGHLTTLRPADSLISLASLTVDAHELRYGQLVFLFDDYQLIVNGGTHYRLDQLHMEVDRPQTRAVLGGTGAYSGIRGQVTTIHNQDGSYSHTFELL